MNLYWNLPLPIGTRINFGFIPAPATSKLERKLREYEAVCEVRQALNKLVYGEET